MASSTQCDRPRDVPTLKVALFGDSYVGKTCLFRRFVDMLFEEHDSSLCFDFKTKQLSRGGKTFNLQVWDTAGMEQFKATTLSYVREMRGALLCYDITNVNSMHSIRRWVSDIVQKSPTQVPMVLVGTKLDKAEGEKSRQVMPKDIKKLAKELKVPFIETSAKDGRCVSEAFGLLLDAILDSGELGNAENQAAKLHLSAETTPEKKCSC